MRLKSETQETPDAARKRRGACWISAAQALVVVLGSMLLIYGPLLCPFNPLIVLGRADTWNYLGAMSFFMDHSIHHGEWPQWNPLLFCGTPFAANPQAAVSYPVHLLRSLLNTNPTPMGTFVSLAIMQGFHLLLLAMGTFCLARDFRMGKLGALVAAVGYMSCGALSWRLVQHWHFIAIAAWFPWQLLLLRRALSADRFLNKVTFGLAAGILFGVGILPGFPQLTIYAGTLLAAYWVLHRMACERPSGSLAACLAGDVAVLALLFGVAVLIAMPSLLPAAEMSAYSVRAKQAQGRFENISRLLAPIQFNPFTHPADLLQALLLYCGRNGVCMMGATAPLLALCCLRHRRRHAVAVCAGLFLIALDCCIEPGFAVGWFLARVSPFFLSEPQRATVFAALFWALLAGFGADALVSPARSRFTPKFWFLLLVVTGVPLLWTLLEWLWLSPEYEISFGAWLLPAMAFAMMLLSFHRPMRTLAACGVLVAFVGEAALWNHTYIPDKVQSDPFRGSVDALGRSAEFRGDNRRWVGGLGNTFSENTMMFTLKPVINGYDPLTIDRIHAKLCSPTRTGGYDRELHDWEVTRVNPSATLLGKRRFRLFEDRESAPAVPSRIEDLHRFYPQQKGAPLLGQPLLYRQEGRERSVLALPDFDGKPGESELCIVYEAEAAGTIEIDFHDPADHSEFPGTTVTWTAPTGQPVEARIPLPDFARVQTVLRPKLDGQKKQLKIVEAHLSTVLDNDDRIEITESRANSVTVRVDGLPNPATLCFMEARYPGWRATLDGSPVPIDAAFEVFQSVHMPSGTHTITFEFDSLMVRLGAGIGAVSAFLACAALLVLVLVNRAR